MAFVQQPLSPLGEGIADISEHPSQCISPTYLNMKKQFSCMPVLNLSGNNSLKMLPLNVFSKFRGILPNDINLMGNNINPLVQKEKVDQMEPTAQKELVITEKEQKNQNEVKKKNCKKKSNKKKPYNITKTHQNIEILEGRINEGTDEAHSHPAMAVSIYNNRKVKNMTKDEECRFYNYSPKLSKQKIPDFWCPRIYDSVDDKLSKIRSKRLKTKIEVFYSKRGLDIPADDIRFSPTYMAIPHIRMETDDDDDITDLDDF